MKWFRRWLLKPLLFRLDVLEIDLMTASTDLTTNVQNLTTAVNAYISAVQAANGNDPAVVAANASLVQLADTVNAAAAALAPPTDPSTTTS